MSAAKRSDAFASALSSRARARADEQRALEAQASAGDVAAIDTALQQQAAREAATTAEEAAPAKGAALWRRRLTWLAVGALPLAAAAIVVVVARGARHAEPVAQNDYIVSVSGHVQVQRAGDEAPSASLEARPDAMQEVILRPRLRHGTVLAAGVLVVRDGIATRVDVAPEVSDAGVVRFDMPGALLAGASEVRVAIAPPARLADAVADATRASSAPDTDRDVVIVSVPVEAAAPSSR